MSQTPTCERKPDPQPSVDADGYVLTSLRDWFRGTVPNRRLRRRTHRVERSDAASPAVVDQPAPTDGEPVGLGGRTRETPSQADGSRLTSGARLLSRSTPSLSKTRGAGGLVKPHFPAENGLKKICATSRTG